jgi:hypothetical protein
VIGRRLRHARTGFDDLLNHLKSTRESESGILMGVHPAGFLEGWVFGDFQSPRLSPDEPSIQPIEASHLGFDRADQITIIFCGSKKSLASGVPMAKVIFASHAMGAVVLPLMLFHQIQLMTCAVLAQRWGARDTPVQE